MTLDQIKLGQSVRLGAIDWARLAPEEAHRLRALGFEEGAEVRLAYRGVFGGRDPLGIEIGRMTIAMRRAHALAMQVEPA